MAKKLADDFFAAFNEKMAGPAAVPAEPALETRAGTSPLWWVIAVIAAMFLLAYCT